LALSYWLRSTKRCSPVAELAPIAVAPITCAGCGVLCDDVIVRRAGDGVRVEPPCGLGAEWFSERVRGAASAPAATIRGQPADVETALTRAAELLRWARRPLLYGFDGATVEDARAAVALADRLGALVATDVLGGAWRGAPAVPLRGASTATLGEIRDRSGLVVIWREDPETTHPRLLDRLGFAGGPRSEPGAQRTLLVVEDRDTATAQRADLQLRWPRERDLEALTGLHVLQRKLELRASELGAELGGLLELINAVPHAAFVHGPGLTAGEGGQRRALALHELVRELCLTRHVVTLALPAAAGCRSAQDVLAWQTGYSEDIDLASGHPELVTATWPPDSGEGVDVALCIEGATDRLLDGATGIALCSLPVEGVEVSIRTAAAGVEAGGTAHRLDGVPLTLQSPLPGDTPTAAALLARLLAEIGS
jgi:formylmethanofuran dehydrogenase subunit B